tara:strand:+ start:431 stop:613 length:183 start_codon:yes stop_codon:yes gene_type:complete
MLLGIIQNLEDEGFWRNNDLTELSIFDSECSDYLGVADSVFTRSQMRLSIDIAKAVNIYF